MPIKKTSDAVEIIHRRYFQNRPRMLTLLEEVRANDDIGRKIYDLRNKARLTQRELAAMIGTTASVICRLEDADYKGHSLAILNRIAAALDKQVRIEFVTRVRKRRSA